MRRIDPDISSFFFCVSRWIFTPPYNIIQRPFERQEWHLGEEKIIHARCTQQNIQTKARQKGGFGVWPRQNSYRENARLNSWSTLLLQHIQCQAQPDQKRRKKNTAGAHYYSSTFNALNVTSSFIRTWQVHISFHLILRVQGLKKLNLKKCTIFGVFLQEPDTI
jgi:hypothetical protein